MAKSEPPKAAKKINSQYDSIVKDVAIKLGLGKTNDLQVTLKSEEYTSVDHHCNMLRYDVSDGVTNLRTVLKTAQVDPVLREKLITREKFSNEAFFYSFVIPNIKPLLDQSYWNVNEYQINLQLPNYYGHDSTEGKEWLLIEDLSTEFVNVQDPENLDRDHLKSTKREEQEVEKRGELYQIVNNLAQSCGFHVDSPNFQIIHKGQYSTTGQHSTVDRYKIKGLNKEMSVVIKRATRNPNVRSRNLVAQKFHNEVTFYAQVAKRLQPATSISAAHYFPRFPRMFDCSLADGSEYLLLEDLENYGVYEHPEKLDKKHLKIGLQALAKFHSASLTWKTNNISDFQTVSKMFIETEMLRVDSDPSKDLKIQKMNSALAAACRMCSNSLSGAYSVSVEKVNNSAFLECPFWVSMEKAEPWSVITHGDCWAKNVLFKYDANKRITGVAFVDFKCARAASPLLDVTNFLLSSGSLECLQDLRPYVNVHKDALTPQMKDYRSHVRLGGPYGLVTALIHHFYCVLYSSVDVDEVSAKLTNVKKDSSGATEKNKKDDRTLFIIKAAHDLRMI